MQSTLETQAVPAKSTIDVQDARAALRLIGETAAARDDPRRWSRALLQGVCRLLDAHVAVLLEITTAEETPCIATYWAAGGWSAKQRQFYVDSLDTLTETDAFLACLLRYAKETRRRTTTAVRSELVTDETWRRTAAVTRRREMTDLDDCLGSVTRLAWPGWTMGLLVYRRAGYTSRFGDREWTLLELIHGELGWIYDAELQCRPAHLSMLSPRMAETLSHIVAGLDERQAARAMGVSPHTVHDYVKALHNHFGVSKRDELIERWTRLNGEKRGK